VQVKPQMNILDLNASQLEGAGDTERTASFEAINEAAEAVRRLREEADQCIGEPVQTGGDTTNSYTSLTSPTIRSRAARRAASTARRSKRPATLRRSTEPSASAAASAFGEQRRHRQQRRHSASSVGIRRAASAPLAFSQTYFVIAQGTLTLDTFDATGIAGSLRGLQLRQVDAIARNARRPRRLHRHHRRGRARCVPRVVFGQSSVVARQCRRRGHRGSCPHGQQ
jgi:hypothetical protein